MDKGLLRSEFDRQLKNLLIKGYPKAAGIEEHVFINLVTPLKNSIRQTDITHENDTEIGLLPFVITVASQLVPTDYAMKQANKNGKEGLVKLFPLKPADFEPAENMSIPKNSVYLILNIERGKEYLNMSPKEATGAILKKKRSPMTIDEGIAVITHYPEFLMKNNCFSLPGSRHKGDKRIPAIWINSKWNPNLGWCWEGNPHTWLGCASLSKRIS